MTTPKQNGAAQNGLARTDVTVRGRKVRVVSAGAGSPLVYLHGAGDLNDWGPALTLLAAGFTVYRPDHPGFNDSDDDPAVDTVLDLAFSYLDLFDALALDRVSLVGASLGGWLAAQIAVLAPERVGALVLAAPAGLRGDVATPDMFTLSPVQLAELLYHREDLRAAAMEAGATITADPAAFQRYLRNRMATAHLAWNPYLHDPKLAGRLHRVRCPVLLLWGEQDRLLPPGHAQQWTGALGQARLELIAGAGHVPQIERPEAFAAAVTGFLAREDQA